jgi:putative transcriptional regulator
MPSWTEDSSHDRRARTVRPGDRHSPVELRPWPAASPAEVKEQVRGEDADKGLVVHYGPDGLPHAFEIERAGRHHRPATDDGTVVEILRDGSERPLVQQVDWARVDATTEEEIAAQIAQDEAEAMRDAAAYVRRVRRKIGLSQVAFARRIGVPVDTVRNWEQGKRGAARPCPRPYAHHRPRSRGCTLGSRSRCQPGPFATYPQSLNVSFTGRRPLPRGGT